MRAPEVHHALFAAAVSGLLIGCAEKAPAGGSSSAKATSWTTKSGSSSKDCCSGKNACKGLGGCKGEGHDCAGKNECKGKGGCGAGMRDCDAKPSSSAPLGSADSK
jgi:hypothetical protein